MQSDLLFQLYQLSASVLYEILAEDRVSQLILAHPQLQPGRPQLGDVYISHEGANGFKESQLRMCAWGTRLQHTNCVLTVFSRV